MMRALTLLALVAGAAWTGSARGDAPASPHRAGAAPAPAWSSHPTAAAAARSSALGVTGSKHDLSVTGPGPVKAVSETQVCIFCHVSHGGGPRGSNRLDENAARFRAYSSSTMTAGSAPAPAQASRMCLSCHDGTIAVGRTMASGRIAMRSGDAPLPSTSRSVLGTDLRRSHPIAVRPVVRNDLKRPAGDDPVRLDHGGSVECTSCHDPHREDADPAERKFLVKPSARSALCGSCHVMEGWATNPSAHQSSTRPADPTATGAGARSLAEAGCATCHQQHGGSERGRLLKDASGAAGSTGDAFCLACHDGRVAAANVAADVRKPYAHALPGADAVHDAAEAPTSAAHRLPEALPGQPRHVACVDCHNPHAANGLAARPPLVGGALAGVWGVDRSGQRVAAARFEYEVCFKCHADSANQPQARGPSLPDTLRRARPDVNLRRVFDPTGPSSHPVVGTAHGTSPSLVQNVPGRATPLSAGGQITCGDCHASEAGPGAGGGGPRGPHGSSYPHLLERNYATADRTPESPQAYALCYKCHDRDVLLGASATKASTFPLHGQHVRDQATPCSVCHASHGVSSLAGSPVANAHLVDFDVTVVRASKSGLLQYTSTGTGSGTCALSCHGHDHDGLTSRYGLAQALRLQKGGLHRVRAAPPHR